MSVPSGLRRVLIVAGTALCLVVALACSSSPTNSSKNCTTDDGNPAPGIQGVLTKRTGDGAEVAAGGTVTLQVLLTDLATDVEGNPHPNVLCNATIDWTPGQASGTVAPAKSITLSGDSAALGGTAQTVWTPGTGTAPQMLTATVENSSPIISVTFIINVQSGDCVPSQTIYFGDNFSGISQWTTSVFTSNGTTSHAETTPTTGGNPTGFRQMTETLGLPVGTSGTSNLTVAHLYTGTTYNPSLSGDICYLVYNEDQIDQAGHGGTWGPMVTQGGKIYSYHPADSLNSATWVGKGPYILHGTDFTPAGLDLLNGGPIQFGFLRGGTTGSNPTGPLTLMTGIDNWKFEIHRK